MGRVQQHREGHAALVTQPLGLVVRGTADRHAAGTETRHRPVELDEPFLAGQAAEVAHQLHHGQVRDECLTESDRTSLRVGELQVERNTGQGRVGHGSPLGGGGSGEGAEPGGHGVEQQVRRDGDAQREREPPPVAAGPAEAALVAPPERDHDQQRQHGETAEAEPPRVAVVQVVGPHERRARADDPQQRQHRGADAAEQGRDSGEESHPHGGKTTFAGRAVGGLGHEASIPHLPHRAYVTAHTERLRKRRRSVRAMTIPEPAARERDEVFLELTKSICPVCKTTIDAEVNARDNQVFLRKRCAEHGEFEARVYGDAQMYVDAQRFNKPGTRPLQTQTEVKDGCPQDCGLCPEHKQHACLGIIEVNTGCNLDCPICFADSGSPRENGPDGYSITLDQCQTMIDAFVAAEGEPEVVMFSGGEPTIHPDILQMIDLAQASPIRSVNLNTNGIRLASDKRFVAELGQAQPAGQQGQHLPPVRRLRRRDPPRRSAAATCARSSSARSTTAPKPASR